MSHEMVFCTQCGKQIHASTKFCPHCGATQPTGAVAPAAAAPSQPANVAAIPEGVKGWSWGAFLLNWIWAIGNKTWIGLLAFLPIVNIVMAFVLGFKGREWAWKNNTWRDLEHFNQVQKKWSIAGLVVVIVALVGGVGFGIWEDYMKKPHTNAISLDLTVDEVPQQNPAAHQSTNRHSAAPYVMPQPNYRLVDLMDMLRRSGIEEHWIATISTYLSAPDQFWQNCVAESQGHSQTQGGLNEKEAHELALNVCRSEAEIYRTCIERPTPDAAAMCLHQHAAEIAVNGD